MSGAAVIASSSSNLLDAIRNKPFAPSQLASSAAVPIAANRNYCPIPSIAKCAAKAPASGAAITPAIGGSIEQRIRKQWSGTGPANASATSVAICSNLQTTTRLWT